jgi:hypothetical protein
MTGVMTTSAQIQLQQHIKQLNITKTTYCTEHEQQQKQQQQQQRTVR